MVSGNSEQGYNHRWQLLEERVTTQNPAPNPESLAPACQYVWGERYIDDLICRDRDTDANGTLDETRYVMQDANWNVAALFAGTGVSERYVYSAYGAPTVLTGAFTSRASSLYAWDHLYTGRQLDPETGLYHYRNRYYSADLGRFLTRDPIGYWAGDRNLYRYIGDSPVNRLDPNGTNIYLKQDWVHQAVCVDMWDSCEKPLGIRQCYTFAATGSWRWFPLSYTWLGWPIWVSGPTVGFEMEGEIMKTGDPGYVVSQKITTAFQDRAWKSWMDNVRVGTRDVYTLLWLNCRAYSQWEFADAP